MAIRSRFVRLANAIATFASLAFACCSIGVAQATPLSLSDRDMPTVEIYPRFPVSKTFSPGPSSFANDYSRAPVVVTIYSLGCPATTPLDTQREKIKTSIVGNRFDVSGVRFGFPAAEPLCFMMPEGPLIYSVFLGDLGPGTYQAAVSGLPGDVPLDENYSRTAITTMTREFVVLNLDQAGKALIENPVQDSVQSGVGLISGWACVADRVEISIDGGERIKVPGEMGRADVKPVCGHGTAGFGLLTNFNLLDAGTHTVQVYVKGVAIGEPTRFSVAVLGIGASKSPVAEYYHAGFDHYFITRSTAEMAALDSGQTPGWSKTGETFFAYGTTASGLAETCRFFSTSFSKSSHFYTPYAAECAALKNSPDWQYEGVAFYTNLPSSTGICPSGTAALYRLYNNGKGGAPNHRYTTSLGIRSQMIAQGWVPEGGGALGVVACVPG